MGRMPCGGIDHVLRSCIIWFATHFHLDARRRSIRKQRHDLADMVPLKSLRTCFLLSCQLVPMYRQELNRQDNMSDRKARGTP